MTRRGRRPPVRRLAGLLLGAALAGALLWPEADRGALVVQGVARLLEQDVERSLARPDGDGIFATLGALAREAPIASARIQVRVDGAPATGAGLERAIATRWNRYRVESGAPLPAPAFDRAGPRADLNLALRVETAGDRIDLGAEVSRGATHRSLRAAAGWPLPGRSALLPPLVAVALGLAFGRTLLALFLGIYAGAVVLAAPDSGAWAPLRGLWDVFAVVLRREVVDGFRLEILGFIAALIAMLGVITRAGGIKGLIERFLGRARTARASLLLTGGMGLVLFFDDYANCVLVGTTMRPITDRMRVAREKLAYVVDSTAAPVAAISLVSTWIAFQVSVYSPQLASAGISHSGYALFVETLPYRFYCLLTLFFVLCVILTQRDFGPMARAERRARTTGQLVRPGGRAPISDAASRIEPEPGMPADWRLAALPIALTIGVTAWRIFAEGGGVALLERDPAALLTLAGLTPVLLAGSGAGPVFAGGLVGLGSAAFLAGSNRTRLAIAAGSLAVWATGGMPGGPVSALLWFCGAAAATGIAARLLRVRTQRPCVPGGRLLKAAFASAQTLGFAVVLLFEAWMIGAVCRDLATADYLVALLSGALPAGLLPLLLFGLACLVSFATGSSWSTMSILLPNVVALAAAVGAEGPLGPVGMVALCISAVLEGAVFGDHCSPISDTTVLSSVSSGCDHLDHVVTQAPYAALVAAVAVLCGYAPLLWWPGWSAGVGLLCGAAVLAATLWGWGRPAAPLAPLATDELVQ